LPDVTHLPAWILIGCCACAACAAAEPAATAQEVARTRQLATLLRSPKASTERLADATKELAGLGPQATATLRGHLDREIARLEKESAARPSTVAIDERIEPLRRTLRNLRDDPNLSKERLAAEGLATLEALTGEWARREAVLAAWMPKVAASRAHAERLRTIAQAWRSTRVDGGDADAALARLADVEARLAGNESAAAQVLAENERLGAALPPEEVAGMRSLNTLRMACGLQPLLIDPKLCAAAVGHSADMEQYGFFAHQSPLPGKKEPWDRAKLAGTTASGENIFMGSPAAAEAIKGWFLSPGHHKNMFGDGHRRQGLGRSGKHWTQLFGAD
jgi:uncharacterized protein YkwD